MAKVDKSGTVTIVSHFPGPDRCRGEAAHREGRDHPVRVHGENKGGEGYVSGDVAEDEVEA